MSALDKPSNMVDGSDVAVPTWMKQIYSIIKNTDNKLGIKKCYALSSDALAAFGAEGWSLLAREDNEFIFEVGVIDL